MQESWMFTVRSLFKSISISNAWWRCLRADSEMHAASRYSINNPHATSRGSQTRCMKASNHSLQGKWNSSGSRQHIIHHFICVHVCLCSVCHVIARCSLRKKQCALLSLRLIIGKTRTEHSIQASWQPVMAKSWHMRERESDWWDASNTARL